MFNLNKIIQIIKRGGSLKKPFNIKKKAEELEEYDEDNIIDRLDREEALRQEKEQKQSPVQVPVKSPVKSPPINKQVEEVYNQLDGWVKENSDQMRDEFLLEKEEPGHLKEIMKKRPEDSLLGENYFLVNLINNAPNSASLIDILAERMSSHDAIDEDISKIFIETMLAKAKVTNKEIMNAPVGDIAPPVGIVDPEKVVPEKVAPEKVVHPTEVSKGYYPNPNIENITDPVWAISTQFDPGQLKLNGNEFNDNRFSKVLESLKETGTGSMYDASAFTDAVDKTFSEPKRFEFFLQNPQFLYEPFPPGGNVFDKVPQLEPALKAGLDKLKIKYKDIPDGLKKAFTKKAGASKDDPTKQTPSARSPMVAILRENAENELNDILLQLNKRLDPSIVHWFQSELSGFDKEVSGLYNIDGPEFLEKSTGGEVGKTPSDQIHNKATIEEQEKAAGRVGSMIHGYLGEQLDVMSHMNDSVVTSSMVDESNKYFTLLENYEKAQSEADKLDIKRQMEKQMNMYTQIEFIHAFSKRAIDQINSMFKEAHGKGAKKERVSPGKSKLPTAIAFSNEFGKNYIPESTIKEIFKGSNYDNEKEHSNKSYVDMYKDRINKGEITDPYSPDWSKMVNRNVPYNSSADIYMVKSQIRQAYSDAKAKRPMLNDSMRMDDDQMNYIFNTLNGDATSREMLQYFSAISPKDNGPKQLQKQKSFINLTVNQTDKNLEDYKACYDSRKKYNEERQEIINKDRLSDEEKRIEISEKNIEERTGQTNEFVMDNNNMPMIKNGKFVYKKISSPPLKNIKDKVGHKFWPIMPKILKEIKDSSHQTQFEKNAERDFIQLFNHSASKYEGYSGVGASINSFDSKKRSNTDLYYAIVNSQIPRGMNRLKELTDMKKSTVIKKQPAILETVNDSIKSMRKLFAKKRLRSKFQNMLNKFEVNRENLFEKDLNHKAMKEINALRNMKGIDESNYKNYVESHIPKRLIEDFYKTVDDWNGKDKLDNDLYISLGIHNPVKTRISIDKSIIEYKKKVKALDTEIENLNDIIEKNENILKQNTTTANASYFRMIYAEYNKVMSKIDQLERIQKFSYKFASINNGIIDDTIKRIEDDFVSFLDSLLE